MKARYKHSEGAWENVGEIRWYPRPPETQVDREVTGELGRIYGPDGRTVYKVFPPRRPCGFQVDR